ncbi:MAG: hypothetical protein IIY32_11265 [Thermoguttaceae bacterium]|nr:hypothetical protein [Thermoguttaceae bacterium]MBQ3823083.1 hypothetical protein [Thermoguttaceae bacterium]
MSAVFCAGCACTGGYQIGPYGLYDSGIKTVYVPMVEANTYRYDFSERLTEAIIKKICEQTPYRIGTYKKTDSILTVRLTGEAQQVAALNRYDDTREKRVCLTAEAVWTDVRGVQSTNTSILAGNARNPNDGVKLISQSFLVPEMGQSTETAQQEAIDTLAEQIVGLMESAW